MADGHFPTLVSKDRLPNSASNVMFIQLSDGSTVLSTTGGALDVNVDNTVTIQDGGNTITVDGTVSISGSVTVTATALDIRALTHATDSVKVGDGTSFLDINTDGSINVNIISSVIAGEVHSYDTTSAVASDGTDNHDYTVANATMLLSSVIASASGGLKFEVQTGPVASLVTKAVGFIPKEGGTQQIFFDPAIEVPVASTGTVRVIRTNRQGAAQDVYSTIIGRDI